MYPARMAPRPRLSAAFRPLRRDWTQGGSSWTTDYPRSDRHFSAAVRRLTRIHARSVEQPVNLDEGDEYNWPWLYAVEVGHWNLTDAQAKALREYLLRGGFFMCDDFHGTEEWEVFVASMQRVFPDRPIVEIPNADPIFHAIYDLDDRYQVPGRAVPPHRPHLRSTTATTPHWRGIYDDSGRLMVAICFDMDLGDSWEHADNPEYPEQFSGPGHPHRRQLRGLRDDALSRFGLCVSEPRVTMGNCISAGAVCPRFSTGPFAPPFSPFWRTVRNCRKPSCPPSASLWISTMCPEPPRLPSWSVRSRSC